MAAMLKAANEGQYNFLNEVKIYGERAKKLKDIFLHHGFHLVYDNDLGDPIADGFYYDIDKETPLTAEDLDKIEAEMKKDRKRES